MHDKDIFAQLIRNAINDMGDTIDSLYHTTRTSSKNILLNNLRKQLANIELLTQGLLNSEPEQQTSPQQPITDQPQDEPSRTFTEEELAAYTGTNGMPAYVAVDGIVYDVTANAAWAGAAHFGLTPGRDLTRELASCHSGQPIVNKLKKVGTMLP